MAGSAGQLRKTNLRQICTQLRTLQGHSIVGASLFSTREDRCGNIYFSSELLKMTLADHNTEIDERALTTFLADQRLTLSCQSLRHCPLYDLTDVSLACKD